LEIAQGEPESEDWVRMETASAELGDERLNQRLELVLRRLVAQPEKSIPVSSRGWSEAQAAYHFSTMRKSRRRRSWLPTERQPCSACVSILSFSV